MGTSSSRQSQSQSHSTTIAHSPPTGHGHSHGHGHGHGSTRTCSVPNESGESQSTIGVQEENEYPHLGSVQVSLSWLNPNALRSNDTDNSYIVTAKGGIFYGNSSPSPIVMSELDAVSMAPGEYPLMDSRAHQLLIAYDNGWNAISSPEVFSRHTGTCLIIGDRTNQGRGHEIKLGDCFRLGSVGVVVSELKHPGKKEERLDTQRLQYLREEALNFEHDGDEAVLAAKEENGVMNHSNVDGGVVNDDDEEMVSPTARDNISGNLFCYMCYESHDTPEDHLVAPCACKGDTRYLHVQCLQKWYQSSLAGWRSLVIRTTGSGAPACKICGMAYKTTMTNLDGVKTNLLEADHPGPYMSLVVVTRHDTSPELFNTKFRLNFGPGYRIGSTTELNTEDPEMNPSELTIGRSSMCNMVLDYRTVSTVHAKLFYRDGAFQLQDARSSNGTMLYLQGPLKLPLNQSLRLRMGRSTLAIEARRSLTASLRTVFTKQKLPPCKASLDELQRIMALAPSMLSKAGGRTQEKDQMRTNLMRNFRDETESNLNDADAEVEARGRGGRSNSPRGRNNVPSETTNEPAVSHHRLVSTTNASGSPRLFVTEEMLRDIFRHHQCQLPQGTCAQVPGNDQSSSIPRGGGGAPIATIAMRDGINIDSPLILGDRPSSRQGSAGISPANSSTPPPSGLIVDGGENNMADHDSQTQSQMNTAAVAIPPTALVYNHGLTTATSSGGPQRSDPHQDISSVNNLASITNATLSSRDADGNPIVNQTEFLLQLDHQLQTIETCVQEAMEGALATIGDYASPDDKEREHAEMRVQRAIISQSIQKDTRTGRSVVDNESILLAATVICTKASAIAALTTGKESRKADKVAKRYAVIADKANEMIIKRAIRQSAHNTCIVRNRMSSSANGFEYYDEDEEVVFKETFVVPDEPDEQDDNAGMGGRDEKEDVVAPGYQKQEQEVADERKEAFGDVCGADRVLKMSSLEDDNCDNVENDKEGVRERRQRPLASRSFTFHEDNVNEDDAALKEGMKQSVTPEKEDQVLHCQTVAEKEMHQMLSILKDLSNKDILNRDFCEELECQLLALNLGADMNAEAKNEHEVAMALLMQALQAAAAGGEVEVNVAGDDMYGVVEAIRDISERRKVNSSTTEGGQLQIDRDVVIGDQVSDVKEESSVLRDTDEHKSDEAHQLMGRPLEVDDKYRVVTIAGAGEDSLLVNEEQSISSILKEETTINGIPDTSVSEVMSS